MKNKQIKSKSVEENSYIQLQATAACSGNRSILFDCSDAPERLQGEKSELNEKYKSNWMI